MTPRPYVLGEPLNVPGAPPWDGTGVPLPVDDNGWPVIPDTIPVIPKITSPADGATVDPLEPILGTARPGVSVTLQYDHNGTWTDMETTTADAVGEFAFTGTTPMSTGAVDLRVVTADGTSSVVSITVVEDDAPSAAQDGTPDAADGGYDPSTHTVAEVQEYLAANPDQTDAVLAAERAGKARTTLIGD